MERLTEKGNYSKYVRKSHVTVCDVECKLGEYEQAEEDGLLIRLPLAIGKPIYKVCFASEIKDGFVYEGTMTLKFYADNIKDFENGIVYATKAEAEQALAKMKGV